MKEWGLKLLIVAGVLATVIVLVVAIYICIAGWSLDGQQVDEENPPCLDQSQEARESQREDLGIEYFLLFAMLVV